MAEKIVEVNGKRYMKVQKGKYFDKKKNRKMRRHHPVRWILVSAFCLLIVAPVGFIFGAFYDPSTKNVADSSEQFTENFTNTLAKSLTQMDGGKLKIELDNNFLDSTLVIAQDKLLSNPTISQFVKKLYCNINGNIYDFILDVQFAFFKTRVHLQTELTFDEVSQSYIFKISNIVLGRLPLGGLAKKFLPQFISENDIKSAIQAIFPNCDFSLANMQITYKRADLKTDLYHILNVAGIEYLQSPLSSVLLNLYDTVGEQASFKDKITIQMDFSKIPAPKETIRNPIDASFKTNILGHSKKVVELLNDKNVNLTSEDSGTIFKYFVTGYSKEAQAIFDDGEKKSVSDACKTYINDIMKPEPGSELELKDYHGDPVYIKNKLDETSLDKEIVLPTISSLDDLRTGVDISFTEATLSKFIRSTPMLGYTIAMPLKIGDNYNFTYVIFDDFNINIEKGKMNIFGDINLNGFQLPMMIESTASDITGTNRKFNISPDKIYIGSVDLGDDVKNTMLDYISSGFTGGDIFSYDKTAKKFVFDISKISVSDGTKYSSLINGVLQCKESFEFLGQTITKDKIDFTCSALHKDGETTGSMNFKIKYLD